jgi:F0F1-type ATP synthase assembly protein I
MKEYPNRRQNKSSKTNPEYLRYTGLGLQIIGVVLGMAIIGHWLDKRFENVIPGFTLSLSLLAVFAILYKLIKSANKK